MIHIVLVEDYLHIAKNQVNNIGKKYNKKLLIFIRTLFFLILLIGIKIKFGLDREIGGFEFCTGFFVFLVIYLGIKQVLMILMCFFIFIFVYYGIYTSLGYFVGFISCTIILSIFKTIIKKNIWLIPFIMAFFGFSIFMWYLPVNYLLTKNITYCLTKVTIAIPFNLIEGAFNFGIGFGLYTLINYRHYRIYKSKIILPVKQKIKKKKYVKI